MEYRRKFLIAIILAAAAIAALSLYLVFKGPKEAVHPEAGGRHVEYYTCGMHPSVRVSPEEYAKGTVNCPICGMKLVPVFKKEEGTEKQVEKRILFYRNPTDPSQTSLKPMNDKNGNPYIPVYEETGENSNYYGCGMEGAEHVFDIKGIEGMRCPICGMPLKKLSKEEADKLRGVAGHVEVTGKEAALAGVLTEPVKKMELSKKIRTVGRVAYDPMLAVAEEEYISALNASQKIARGGFAEIKKRSQALVESSAKKLELLGLNSDQIQELRRTRKPHSSLVLPEDKMWVYGDVYEYEMSWLKPGQNVQITAEAVPGVIFDGKISSIVPVIDPKTRTARFRVEVNNPNLKLKPDMYVDIETMSEYETPNDQKEVLAVPKSAVLDTGTRKIVWVDEGGGKYEGREIVTGPAAAANVGGKTVEFYPVLKGLEEGDLVVTKANFLIDSQSQITGEVSTSYGGALGTQKNDEQKDEEKPDQIHQH